MWREITRLTHQYPQMDKNTIYGLVLMAAIFFAFVWLSPKPEANPDAAVTPDNVTENTVSGVDSLTDTEREWLIKNIAENGKSHLLEDGRHAVVLSQDGINLTLVGDSLFGTVTVDGKALDWADISALPDGRLDPAQHRAALATIRELSNSMGRYGRFAQFLKGDVKNLHLENDVIALDLTSLGGTISKAELKKYDTEYSADESKKVKNKVVIFEGNSNLMEYTLPVPQNVTTSGLYFTPRQVNDSTVRMTLDFADDTYWGIEYILPKGDSYVITMKVIQKNMQPVVQSNVRTLGLEWNQKIHRQEKGRMFEERNSGIYYKFAGGSVEHLSESKHDTEDRQAKVKWIAFKNQFFSSVLIARKNFNQADFTSDVLKNSDYLKDVKAHAEVNDYDWTSENPATFDYYIGPNLYPLLSSLDKKIETDEDLSMTRLIPLGWTLFRWINTIIIIPVFSFLGTFISNYGIIILLLTIFIKLILFPLTYKSYRSQAVMRTLAPEIQAINDKYPGNENAMTRQQKTMALYSKAGANPMSGCLPMLLQMPILFAMFTFFPSAIELRGQSFLWAHDLSAPDAIISWSGHIPLITDYFGNHISLFCLLMTVTNIIYTKLSMQNSPGQMPGMKVMMYLMPVMFLVWFNNYAAGLSYYYFLSLLITIAQTYIFRLVITPEKVKKQMAENAKKPKKKSGFMARLEEMQKQQQQMLREQQKNNRR